MALFGVNSMIIFSSCARDTDSRTQRLSKKKSWGSRLLKCCSVSSTLKAVRKTNSQNDLGYCSLLNYKFVFYATERSRHVWHSHSGPGVTGKIVTEVNLPTQRCIVLGCFSLFWPSPVPLHSTSLKEELKDLKETSLFEEERVKAVLQGLRR